VTRKAEKIQFFENLEAKVAQKAKGEMHAELMKMDMIAFRKTSTTNQKQFRMFRKWFKTDQGNLYQGEVDSKGF
jgi:hypothetical protein